MANSIVCHKPGLAASARLQRTDDADAVHAHVVCAQVEGVDDRLLVVRHRVQQLDDVRATQVVAP